MPIVPGCPRARLLRLSYRVPQVRHADACDHRGVAQDGRNSAETVEESNSGAEQNRRDVDVELVEEAGIQALLDGVRAMDSHGLPGGGDLGLADGAFEAIGHEVDGRVGSRPSDGDVVSQHEGRSPGVVSAPALGDVESTTTGKHGTKSGREYADVLGAWPGHPERHGMRPSGVDLDVS